MTTEIIMVVIWYLGALVIFWQLSVRYRNGTTLATLAPFIGIACLMLMNASALYYNYVDAPLYRMLSYFWYVFGTWAVYQGYRMLRDRIKK